MKERFTSRQVLKKTVLGLAAFSFMQLGLSNPSFASSEPSQTPTVECGTNTFDGNAVHLLNSGREEVCGFKKILKERLVTSGALQVAVGVDGNRKKGSAQMNYIDAILREDENGPELISRLEITPASIYLVTDWQQIDALFNAGASYIEDVSEPALPVDKITLSDVKATNNPDVKKRMGADVADANGATGAGWHVVSIDTGVIWQHSILGQNGVRGGRIRRSICINGSGMCPSGKVIDDTTPNAGSSCQISFDGCNHGTKTAGVLSEFSQANVIVIQIYSVGDVAMAVDYAYRNNLYPTAAVSISLKWGQLHNGICNASSPLFSRLFAGITEFGIAVVPAAGNDFQYIKKEQLWEPACITGRGNPYSDGVIVAGATSLVDTSDRGLVEIRASYSQPFFGLVYLLGLADLMVADPSNMNAYIPGTGTSFAAPVIAAGVVRARGTSPSRTPSQIEIDLYNSGDSILDTYVVVEPDGSRRVVKSDAKRVNYGNSRGSRPAEVKESVPVLIFLPYVSNASNQTSQAPSTSNSSATSVSMSVSDTSSGNQGRQKPSKKAKRRREKQKMQYERILRRAMGNSLFTLSS